MSPHCTALTLLLKIQKIMNDFERESSTMDMKEEMMSDAVDDAMEGEDEGEGEEMESDKILKEVFDEIGMNMNEAVSCPKPIFHLQLKAFQACVRSDYQSSRQ
jgi:division protein CdvB (Snf7/Vps24/ESCRT-III family)